MATVTNIRYAYTSGSITSYCVMNLTTMTTPTAHKLKVKLRYDNHDHFLLQTELDTCLFKRRCKLVSHYHHTAIQSAIKHKMTLKEIFSSFASHPQCESHQVLKLDEGRWREAPPGLRTPRSWAAVITMDQDPCVSPPGKFF